MAERSRVLAILTLIQLVCIGFTAHAAEAVRRPWLILDPPGRQSAPQTDGEFVIWLDDRAGDIGNADLYGARLGDGQVFPIATDALDLAYADIADGVVVWAEAPCSGCPRDIVGMSIATGERFSVTASEDEDDGHAKLSGDWIVWIRLDATGTSRLMARDISTMSDAIELTTINAVGYGPAISGDRVVWEDLNVGDGQWGLYTMRIGDNQPTPVTTSTTRFGGGGSFGYDVAGDTIAYVDATFQLTTVNVATGATTAIFTGAYSQQPTTDGRYVVWEDRSAFQGTDGRRVDLRGYDLQTESEFVVASGTEQHLAPNLRAGTLVWSYGTDSETAINAAPLSDILPSAPRPDPGTTSADWTYFSETGHYLGYGFKSFWEQSGGLPVFGYPLTEEFTERNPDTTQFYTVQYFERQRYEWHPENADTPYEVLLGRLGAQLLAMQGRDWQDFPTADPSTPYYFPETEHAIDERFYGYWSSHGLEFGDAGVSFRESLALFGYPISEPMMETNADGATVLTQYFERAVFEYHPENAGTAYVVLLRRVGAEALAARDWSSSTAMN